MGRLGNHLGKLKSTTWEKLGKLGNGSSLRVSDDLGKTWELGTRVGKFLGGYSRYPQNPKWGESIKKPPLI
jgi:hypothetical protein